jgi:hypothetical protein
MEERVACAAECMTTETKREQRYLGPGEPNRVPLSLSTMAQSNPAVLPQAPPYSVVQHNASTITAPVPGRPSPSIVRGADQLLAIIEEEKAKVVAQLRTTHEADKLWWSQSISHLQQQAKQTVSQLEIQRDHALVLVADSERRAQEALASLESERQRTDVEKARADSAEERLAAIGLL